MEAAALQAIDNPGAILFGIVTIVFGIVIIAYPQLLSYIVGGYLIVMGLVAILASL